MNERLDRLESLVRQLQGSGTADVYGVVNGDGTVDRGVGFGANQSATGFYEVIFDQEFDLVPVVMASALGVAGYAVAYNEATTGFLVATIDNTGASANREFSFLAKAI